MGQPRKFKPEFKAQLALAALRGDQSMATLCRQPQLSDTRVSRWRQQLIQPSPELFAGQTPVERAQQRMAERERVVGQLTVELAAANKFSTLLS